jgi:hypothetical protein
VELVVLRYRDSEQLYVGMSEAALCALRSQARCCARCAVLLAGEAGDRLSSSLPTLHGIVGAAPSGEAWLPVPSFAV